MAQKVITEFIDDIDGTVAERTFTFAIDGTNYAIDLSAANIREFNDAVAGFVESARKVGKVAAGTARARSGGARPSANREHLAAVRQWARANGMSVNDRGRVSAQVLAAFDAAHTGSSHLAAVG